MQGPLRYFGYAAAGLILGGSLSSACASDTSEGVGGAGNAGGMAGGPATGGTSVTGGTGGTGGTTDASTGGGINIDGSMNDGAINPDAACDLQTYQATITKKPVDVIFIVDNSCSMDAEMEGIEKNINQNFAQIIAGSGLDYRVILIGEHGEPKAPSSYESSLCIGPPLGGAPCDNVPQNTAPKNNPPVFYHYDHDDVESWDGWCKMADWYKKPDRYNLALGGWTEWLRLEALKTFVMVSDDRVDCTWASGSPGSSCTTPGPKCYDDTTSAQNAAQQFDQDLLALDPAQFGTAQSRNYVWHSIVGVAANSGSPTGAYEPTDPMVASSTKCTSAVNSGPGHQALSILTGGLRFPVCEGLGFDAVFKKIAEGVIKGAKIQCDFAMPEAPAGKELDPKTIQILYTPGNGLPAEKYTQVADASQCAPDSFYIESASDAGDAAGADGGADKLVLCPAACSEVQADDKANVQILALCKTGGPI